MPEPSTWPSREAQQRLIVWVVLLSAAVFAPGLAGVFVWDDHPLIEDNAFAQSWAYWREALTSDFWHTSDPGTSSTAGFYRPVVKLAFLAQYTAFAGAPWAFKAVNLLLHLGCVVLVHRWLLRRLGPEARTAAALGTALFAVHPSRAETVSWISGSTDLWLTLFVLLALWAIDAGRPLLAASTAALACFSKEAALVVPVALLADALLLPGDARARRERWKGAVAVLGGVGLAAAVRSQLVPLRYHAMWGEGFGAFASRTFGSLGGFLERAVLPLSPSVLIGALPTDAAGGFIVPVRWIVFGVLGAASFLAVATLAWKRAELRGLVADLAWFLVPLAPTLNLVPLKYKMLLSERFLYLPMIGLAAVSARLLRGAPGDGRRPALAFGVLLFAGALLTAGHVPHFRSDVELWSHESALRPDQPYGAEMLARARWSADDLEAALPASAHALRLAQGDDETARLALLWASIRQQLATDAEQTALLEARQVLDALAEGREVRAFVDGRELALRPSAAAREKLLRMKTFASQRALAHARTGQGEEAERQLRAQLLATPERSSTYVDLARILAWRGRVDEARRVVREGEQRAPSTGIARTAALLEALASPRAPAEERGEALLLLGSPSAAAAYLTPLLQAQEPRPALVRTLVRAQLAAGRPELARSALTDARARAPAQASAWAALEAELTALTQP